MTNLPIFHPQHTPNGGAIPIKIQKFEKFLVYPHAQITAETTIQKTGCGGQRASIFLTVRLANIRGRNNANRTALFYRSGDSILLPSGLASQAPRGTCPWQP